MVKADIKAGICNLHTVVEADSSDGMTVQLRIESECPQVRALAAELTEVDAFQELFKPQKDTNILALAAKHRLHTSCIVPAGILKAIEAAARMALPAESSVSLHRQE